MVDEKSCEDGNGFEDPVRCGLKKSYVAITAVFTILWKFERCLSSWGAFKNNRLLYRGSRFASLVGLLQLKVGI